MYILCFYLLLTLTPSISFGASSHDSDTRFLSLQETLQYIQSQVAQRSLTVGPGDTPDRITQYSYEVAHQLNPHLNHSQQQAMALAGYIVYFDHQQLPNHIRNKDHSSDTKEGFQALLKKTFQGLKEYFIKPAANPDHFCFVFTKDGLFNPIDWTDRWCADQPQKLLSLPLCMGTQHLIQVHNTIKGLYGHFRHDVRHTYFQESWQTFLEQHGVFEPWQKTLKHIWDTSKDNPQTRIPVGVTTFIMYHEQFPNPTNIDNHIKEVCEVYPDLEYHEGFWADHGCEPIPHGPLPSDLSAMVKTFYDQTDHRPLDWNDPTDGRYASAVLQHWYNTFMHHHFTPLETQLNLDYLPKKPTLS